MTETMKFELKELESTVRKAEITRYHLLICFLFTTVCQKTHKVGWLFPFIYRRYRLPI